MLAKDSGVAVQFVPDFPPAPCLHLERVEQMVALVLAVLETTVLVYYL